jgi:DNA-directed RNA polymerase beta subunit
MINDCFSLFIYLRQRTIMNTEICWDILDTYFQKGGSAESINPHVKHQIDSYNKFIDNMLGHIITGFNPIKISNSLKNENGEQSHKIYINVLQPSLTKPIYHLQDGTQSVMTPYIARMNKLTYASSLYVNVNVVIEATNKDGIIEKFNKTINGVYIGKIPVMVRSKACILQQMPALGEEFNNECRYDYGGYFIINGSEKVLISQDRINENKTLVFQPSNNNEGLYAEIRSMSDASYLPPKTTSLNMSGKLNHMGRIIRLNTSFIKSEAPVFVMFRALGIISDKEIMQHIVYDLDNKDNQRIITELMACCEDACDIHTQEQAHNALIRIMTGLNKTSNASDLLKNNIINDFLPHVGKSYRRKALYLGYMIRKMIRIFLGYDSYDNRDSYMNKRIDTPGILMSNLFRQCYGKMTKEIKVLIEKELNLWRANQNSIATCDIISDNNIHRYFRQSLLESWLKYSLSTGNWGIKSIGSFQNIRQGVSQVLNRMSYASTLSHLRRINTAMEKNGKLVQPRKLDNSQIGMICPAECFDPNTPILLWKGTIKKAEDIVVGDYLIDDKGNSVRVKSTCSGYKRMYEVIQNKNNFMNYTVTDNHILTLKVKNHKNIRNHRGKKEFRWFDKKELKFNYKDFNNIEDLNEFSSYIDDDNVIDITIEQYLSLPEYVQKQLYTFKSDGINWETKEVALDPYILGMWLGDRLSNGYGFITADKELLDMWIKWGLENDATITKNKHKYRYTISSTIDNTQIGISCNKTEQAPLKKLLAKYNLINNKHIPLDYLTNDRKTRLAVLAGLIDTDGNVRANGHEIRICQGEPNYKIIYDTEFLARSLGFSCHLNNGTCCYTVKGEKRNKPYKELTITGKNLYEIPTVLHRKKLNKCNNPTHEKRADNFLQSSFKLLEKDVQAFVGWQLEGNGRFLLGDMSISHNTPEGASVGLVKNMALSTNISVHMNSIHIRNLLLENGVIIYNDSVDNVSDYLMNLGSADNVYVQINGDIIGYHKDPYMLYNKLKHYKRCGIVYPMTSIIWNIKNRMIVISTEAGRMYRPLLIVDYDDKTGKRMLRIHKMLQEKGLTWAEYNKDKFFDAYVAPCIGGVDGKDEEEGFIEYLDCDEINHSMIAMSPGDLEKGMKGISYPPCYTHCEIHPSLMNGILGVNIPFSDHNQSPRNCYQCISENENVLMSNGTYKMIKEMVVGDEVVCFDLKTKQSVHTKVVHNYNRLTTKIVCNINVVSGRTITATNDHKFMTNQGWKTCVEFGNDTLLGIYMNMRNSNVSSEVGEVIDIMVCNEMGYEYFTEVGLLPLKNTNEKLPVIAKLVGYYLSQQLNFHSDYDKNSYHKDVQYIGFKEYGMYDTKFMIYVKKLASDISWVMKSSDMVQLEFLGGYLSGFYPGSLNELQLVNYYVNGIMYSIMQKMNIADDWYMADKNILNFQKTIGLCYNNSLMNDVAILAEYIMHKNYCNMVNIDKIRKIYSLEKWKSVVYVEGDLIFVPFNITYKSNNRKISDITVESDNHCFIAGNGFAVSNCAMGKQALGVYASNFNKRIDTMGNILNYAQKPLVYTKLSKYTYSNELPSGTNAIVAIMTHTGFNQEDSVMINQSALDRGLFTSTYYKSVKDQCTKNHSTGEEEVFTNPTKNGAVSLKPFSYGKLDDSGFVPKNTHVSASDVIVGKVMPKKTNGTIVNQDNSMSLKANDDGYIDMNYVGTNSEGYKFCNVRIRKNRKPEVGDKLASRSAQKGTIGMVYRHQDMPFTKSGIVPDIIMNPHAIPSRMTMAQLMECIMGKASCHIGACGDSSPFTDCSVESIAKVLELSGMERYGNEIMYNGRTGEQIKTEIFIGPTYYQRLKHMVADKIHARGSNGPIVMLTRQASEGRSKNGGLRLGEMERDCLIGHGISEFLKERMLDTADNFRVFICKNCGMTASVNPNKNIYKCNSCKTSADIVQVRIPYAFKLLSQELYTMNIKTGFACG